MHQDTPEQSPPLRESIPTLAIAKSTVSKRSHDAYGALRFRDFRLLLAGVFLVFFSQQMMTVALGWELYARTHSALVLGGIGLAQVIPVIMLFLPAGYVAEGADASRSR